MNFIAIIHLSIVIQISATPLNLASQEGHTDVVELLVRRGANVDLARKVSTKLIYSISVVAISLRVKIDAMLV